ncbi:MAG TPA: hypothetical protein VN370_11225 [Desulfitobacteriaceae bacterium]|jgi:ATP-dependent RNA circularization protein (DNA/RNA ligase family)|nr:hypothetical protein [Desulfitobacteriaceae bacterium]
MDEEIIGRIIKLKLNMAEKLIGHLPEKAASQIKDLGKIILKSLNENVQDTKEHASEKSGALTHLNHVPIE